MFVIINVETSGISTNDDVIIEIGAIKTDFEDYYEEFHKVYDEKMVKYFKDENLSFNWSDEIKECKLRIESLGDKMLKEFDEFIQGCKIICYYSNFDAKFLDKYGIDTRNCVSLLKETGVGLELLCWINKIEFSKDCMACVRSMYKYIKNNLKGLCRVLNKVQIKDQSTLCNPLLLSDVVEKIKSIATFKSSLNSLFIDAQDRFQIIKGETYEIRIFSFLIKGDKETSFLDYVAQNNLLNEKLKKSNESDLIEIWYYLINTEDVYVILSLRKLLHE